MATSKQQQGQQQDKPYEPKLVRDPKTGDYYDQNQSRSPQHQQRTPSNSNRDAQMGGAQSRNQPGSPQSKTQPK